MDEINDHLIVTKDPRTGAQIFRSKFPIIPGGKILTSTTIMTELHLTRNGQPLHHRADSLYSWPRLDDSQPLADSEVHVWSASLKLASQELDGLFHLLSPDEKTRADRFYFAMDRNHFIAGRGLLRMLLGSYLEMEPSQIEFVYGEFGKPALATTLQDNTLHFNLSHSNGMVLYIFGRNRRVGIDVEYMKPMADMDDFARHCFSPEETTFLDALSGNQKTEAFFKTWTCKEAYLKARGSGLTVPIKQVEVPLGINEDFIINSIGSDQEEPIAWHLKSFQPLPLYQAALAVEGHDAQVAFRK